MQLVRKLMLYFDQFLTTIWRKFTKMPIWKSLPFIYYLGIFKIEFFQKVLDYD